MFVCLWVGVVNTFMSSLMNFVRSHSVEPSYFIKYILYLLRLYCFMLQRSETGGGGGLTTDEDSTQAQLRGHNKRSEDVALN
jgi:hypothetical protein